MEDSKGNIWFGTIESGVWKYDGQSVKNYAKEDGLESNHIWTIYTSEDGELWFEPYGKPERPMEYFSNDMIIVSRGEEDE